MHVPSLPRTGNCVNAGARMLVSNERLSSQRVPISCRCALLSDTPLSGRQPHHHRAHSSPQLRWQALLRINGSLRRLFPTRRNIRLRHIGILVLIVPGVGMRYGFTASGFVVKAIRFLFHRGEVGGWVAELASLARDGGFPRRLVFGRWLTSRRLVDLDTERRSPDRFRLGLRRHLYDHHLLDCLREGKFFPITLSYNISQAPNERKHSRLTSDLLGTQLLVRPP
ncbi:hypothetical protein R3P38DRAFT_2938578 [Favolaschia claudopus]|uniref:Uncharacterized protein n=1 Tax=Favolaschia claudopus TaxID=2862362 RepID=A0AAW0BN54_9AGAR